MPTRSAARLPPAKRAFRRTVRSDDDRSGIDEERPACFSRSFRQACGQARPTKSRTDIAPTIFIAGETSIRNSEIAHHPRFSPRAMLGAISSSRCQTTRVRLMPLATSTCDTKTDAETFLLRTSIRLRSTSYGGQATRLVEPDGIEPTTSCLQSRRSPN